MEYAKELLNDALKDHIVDLNEAIENDKPYSRVMELQKNIDELNEGIRMLEQGYIQ